MGKLKAMVNNRSCYRHIPKARSGVRWFQLVPLVVSSAFFGVALLNGAVYLLNPGTRSGVLGWALVALIPAILGLAMSSAYPEICLDDTGLSITYVFGVIAIPWHSVTEVRKTHSFFVGEMIVVCAKRISVLHYYFGWLYLNGLQQCFPIQPTIEQRAALVAAIEQRVVTSRQNHTGAKVPS